MWLPLASFAIVLALVSLNPFHIQSRPLAGYATPETDQLGGRNITVSDPPL
jgi:hypothetical protein